MKFSCAVALLATTTGLVLSPVLASSSSDSMNVNITSTNKHEKEYTTILDMVEMAYDKACKEHVSIWHWTTTVECTRPGGTATYVSRGITNLDRKPKTLQVCSIGSGNANLCNEIDFTGNEQDDMMQAEALIKGEQVMVASKKPSGGKQLRGLATSSSSSTMGTKINWSAEWQLVVQGIEDVFQHKCTEHTIVLPPGPNTYIMDCTRMGGSVTLAGTESTTSKVGVVPEYLKVCDIGANNKQACRQIDFKAGEFASFLVQVNDLLHA